MSIHGLRCLFLFVLTLPLVLAGCPDKKDPGPGSPTGKEVVKKPDAPVSTLSPEAAKFINQALVAAGGEEKLRANTQFTTRSSGSYMGMPYTSTSTFIPGEMRMDIDMPDGSHMAMVMGMKNCWSRTGPVVISCPKGEHEAARQQAIFEQASRLVALKDGKFKVEMAGTSIEGKEFPTLKISGGGLQGVGHLIFDPASHLLVRTSFPSKMNGVAGTYETVLSEHKQFCGITHPSSFHMEFGGNKVMNETISELNCGPVDGNLFSKPVQVAQGTTVEKTTAQATMACATMKGDYSGVGLTMGKLMGYLGKNKLAPMGAPTMIYVKAPPEARSPEEYVTEVCMPVVATPDAGEEGAEIKIKNMAPTKVLAMYGLGDYSKTSGELAQKLMEELAKRKLKPNGAMRQVTFMNPLEADKDSLVSEMQIPVQ